MRSALVRVANEESRVAAEVLVTSVNFTIREEQKRQFVAVH
jgi:hypothetical protein